MNHHILDTEDFWLAEQMENGRKESWHKIIILHVLLGQPSYWPQWSVPEVLLHNAGQLSEQGQGGAQGLWEECQERCFLPLIILPPPYLSLSLLALDYLSTHLPHTLVILMAPANVTNALNIVNKPPICHITHLVECPCLFGAQGNHAVNRVQWLWSSYLYAYKD